VRLTQWTQRLNSVDDVGNNNSQEVIQKVNCEDMLGKSNPIVFFP